MFCFCCKMIQLYYTAADGYYSPLTVVDTVPEVLSYSLSGARSEFPFGNSAILLSGQLVTLHFIYNYETE
jgi:hypothetical protein